MRDGQKLHENNLEGKDARREDCDDEREEVHRVAALADFVSQGVLHTLHFRGPPVRGTNRTGMMSLEVTLPPFFSTSTRFCVK